MQTVLHRLANLDCAAEEAFYVSPRRRMYRSCSKPIEIITWAPPASAEVARNMRLTKALEVKHGGG